MRNKVLLIICIIWAALVGYYFYQNAYGIGIAPDYSAANDSYYFDGTSYILDNVNDGAYIYKVQEGGKVEKIICLSDLAALCKGEAILNDDGTAVLISTETTVNDMKLKIYNILKFDVNDQLQRMTEWFALDRDGRGFELRKSTDGYMVSLVPDTETYGFVYGVPASFIYDADPVFLQEKREVKLIDMTKAVENDRGQYDYESRSDDYSARLFDNLKFTGKQIYMLNHRLTVICVAALIIGIILFFVIAIVLSRRNRVAYLILIWECMLLILYGTYEAGITYFIEKKGMLIGGTILFVLASAAGILVLLIQSFDLSTLSIAMGRLVRGDADIKKPVTVGQDMESLWNGLLDVSRLIRNLNYSKFKIFEAYYRFAPKRVEQLLNRESITEVKSGDVVHGMGTIAYIKTNISGSNVMNAEGLHSEIREVFGKQIGHMFELIADYQEAGKGSMLATSADLSKITMLFHESNRSCSEFGSSLVKDISDLNTAVFMHYVPYVYGIAGSSRQQVAFLVSDIMKEIDKYTDVFNGIKLKLVITDAVLEREINKPQVRYIGYFETTDGKKVKLFEVLDALPDKERRLKKECEETFSKGMQLYEAGDFYLARNEFAAVIKKNPLDYMARWYLFRAESYLDESFEKDMSIALNK